MDWQDGLAAAIAENQRFQEIAGEDLEVHNWLRESFGRNRPVNISEIVPPLRMEDLVELRKAIDKFRKRATRARLSFDLSRAISAEISRSQFEKDVLRENMRSLDEAISQLSAIDREIVSCRRKGMKLKEIGYTVGLSNSSVCERLARAIILLREELY